MNIMIKRGRKGIKMHILIDIDDDLYTRLFDNGEDNVTDMRSACAAIRKGTPLPKKEHERLIILSEDAIKREKTYSGFSSQYWISEDGLSNATVRIIGADKQDYENDDYYKGAQEEY